MLSGLLQKSAQEAASLIILRFSERLRDHHDGFGIRGSQFGHARVKGGVRRLAELCDQAGLRPQAKAERGNLGPLIRRQGGRCPSETVSCGTHALQIHLTEVVKLSILTSYNYGMYWRESAPPKLKNGLGCILRLCKNVSDDHEVMSG
jgi:hypothetical protein